MLELHCSSQSDIHRLRQSNQYTLSQKHSSGDEMAEMTAPKANNNLQSPYTGENEALTNPKKAKLDRKSLKHTLDQAAIEIIVKKGFVVDTLRREENGWNLLGGATLIGIGLFAQFNPEKIPFQIPANKPNVLCFMHYYFGIVQLVHYLKARHVFMFTYPSTKFRTSSLALSSKLSSSDMYTLTIAGAVDVPSVKLTKSITKWFASDGVLLEYLYSKDVEGLVSDYVRESNKRRRRRGICGFLLLIGISVWFPRQMSISASTFLRCFLMTLFVLKLVALVQ